MEEDIALLDDPTVLGRRRMAIEVRLGEKEILAMAALQVDETIADMKSHLKRKSVRGSLKAYEFRYLQIRFFGQTVG